ncbi:MAG: protein phosphatase 2C domain-containing protein [Clostridiales bacterium]|nr:protein phosphatase 2C domain-containing protein [Clostridiales bacterium]
MIVTWVSKAGGRPVNGDTVGKTRKNGIVCVAVADGLGSEIASEMAVNTVINEFENNPAFSEERIKEYINSANEKIAGYAMTDPELLHISSTIAVLLIKGKKAIWANVGDSRLYRFYDGMIAEVSEDHSMAFLDFVNGSIEYGDIRTDSNRNKLTSALGVSMDGINVSNIIPLDAQTSFLICTDGLWEYITEDEMEDILGKSCDARQWLRSMTELREEKAREKSDNFSAVVVAM